MSGALVGAAILQTLIYLAFIRFIDLYEREPLWYVIPVFIWGFAVATGVSLVFNTLFMVTVSRVSSVQVADFLTAVISAPIVEEASKGLALLLVFLVSYMMARRRGVMEFSGVMDGIVYGSAVGFGFSIAEDLLYYAQFGPETFVVRRIFGGFAHAAFTSITGISLGLVAWIGSPLIKPVPVILGLSGAILLHAAFNFTAAVFGVLAYVVLFVVLLVYVAVIVAWLAVERRAIKDELREEVAAGIVTRQEYDLLPSYFRRRAYYLNLLLSGRWRDWSRARRVHHAAVDLALTKRVSRRSRTAAQQERVHSLRRRIQGIRGLAPGSSP